MSGPSTSAAGALLTLAASLAVAACGASGAQNGTSGATAATLATAATTTAATSMTTAAAQPGGAYRVAVSASGFPAHQRLAQRSRLRITVRNLGPRALPNVAVTITDARWGTAAQPFATLIPARPGLASRSRPVWVIDRPPGPCRFACPSGGPGGAATAYSNTWALGRLARGHAAVFTWTLTAVRTGRRTVIYSVAADLNPGPPTVTRTGAAAAGRLSVFVDHRPLKPRVLENGQVVYSP